MQIFNFLFMAADVNALVSPVIGFSVLYFRVKKLTLKSCASTNYLKKYNYFCCFGFFTS